MTDEKDQDRKPDEERSRKELLEPRDLEDRGDLRGGGLFEPYGSRG